MRFFYICLLQMLACSTLVWSQWSYAEIGEYSHTITYADYKAVFHLHEGMDRVFKARSGLQYHWYGSNKINVTQGGMGGKLLQGEYREFYLNKNLKVKGSFNKGLKEGQWNQWTENGMLLSQTHFSKGLLQGLFKRYGQDGLLIEKGKYRKGKKQGKWMSYSSGDSISMIRYQYGVIKIKKESGPINWFKKKMGWRKGRPNAQGALGNSVKTGSSTFSSENFLKKESKPKPNKKRN